MAWVMPEDRIATGRSVEDWFQFLWRISVGLRYPVTSWMLVFTEASWDWAPQRNLVTTETETIDGERATFSSGAIWAGVAFEWD